MRRAVGDVSCAAGLCPSYPDIRAWAAGCLPPARLSLLTQVAQRLCCYRAGPRPKLKPNRGCTERPECLLITEKHLSVQLLELAMDIWKAGAQVSERTARLHTSIWASTTWTAPQVRRGCHPAQIPALIPAQPRARSARRLPGLSGLPWAPEAPSE